MKSPLDVWSKLPQSVRSWAHYDFANSSYVLIYQAFLLPVFFSHLVVFKGLTLGAWGLANGASTFLGVFISILFGYYADTRGRLKTFRWSIVLSFAGMTLLSIAVGYFHQYVFYLYVITNSFFILSLSLSDSILPYLSSERTAYEYSGVAWGWGYIGGVACMVPVLVLQKTLGEYSAAVFMSVAIFYLLFSVYALKGLRNVKLNEPLREVRKPSMPVSKRALLFFGYWLISECISVIILFYSIYAASELGLSTLTIGLTLLVVQLLGFPATWIGGKLIHKYSHLSLLGITIALWGVIIGLLVINLGMGGLVIIVVLTALVIGNSQSFLRAQYSTLIERSESGFQFGLFSIVAEASVLVGPLVYGVSSDYLHSQKIPLLVLFLLMVVGYGLVRLVIRGRSLDSFPAT